MKVQEFIDLMSDIFGSDFLYCVDYKYDILHIKIMFRDNLINMDLAFSKIKGNTRNLIDTFIKQLIEEMATILLRDINLMIERQDIIGKPLADLRGDNDDR